MSLSDRIRINAGRKFMHSLLARFLFIGVMLGILFVCNINKQSSNHSKLDGTINTQKIETTYVAKY